MSFLKNIVLGLDSKNKTEEINTQEYQDNKSSNKYPHQITVFSITAAIFIFISIMGALLVSDFFVIIFSALAIFFIFALTRLLIFEKWALIVFYYLSIFFLLGICIFMWYWAISLSSKIYFPIATIEKTEMQNLFKLVLFTLVIFGTLALIRYSYKKCINHSSFLYNQTSKHISKLFKSNWLFFLVFVISIMITKITIFSFFYSCLPFECQDELKNYENYEFSYISGVISAIILLLWLSFNFVFNRKKILITIATFLLLLQFFLGNGHKNIACVMYGGKWNLSFNECQTTNSSANINNFCAIFNGEFNECASPCRNEKIDESCTDIMYCSMGCPLVCEQVCSFKSEK